MKKPISGQFLQFLEQKVFPINQAVIHNFIKVSTTMTKFRETSSSNSKKIPWKMSGGKDQQTLSHRTYPATAKWLTSTTKIEWHLKFKYKKCDVSLTKHYCITVSMQKISSIHKLIQQILGSHELNDHAHFWPGPPIKIIEITFSFLEFAPACKK